ncbi:MAG: addiction module protein [Symploca sp. SIO1A3]|nr:addiction module protein [Symploca sp. SIO1A3]
MLQISNPSGMITCFIVFMPMNNRPLTKVDNSIIDNIWLDEAEKRLEAFKAGKTKGIPASDVLGRNS